VKCSALITFDWNGNRKLERFICVNIAGHAQCTNIPKKWEGKSGKSQWKNAGGSLKKKNWEFSDLFAQQARNEKLRKQWNYF